MTISSEIQEVIELCQSLGIPEYTEYLDDEDMIIIAMSKWKSWIKENKEEIYADIHEGEEYANNS